MSLAPLLHAGPIVATHAVAAFAALAAGAVQFVLPKGTRRHRWLGWVWVLLLGFVAAGSFAIHTIRLWGPFSPIHILSVVTLVSLAMAVAFARAGKIEAHRQTMLWVYAMALVLTSLFTLWPGRIMHQVFFGTRGVRLGVRLSGAPKTGPGPIAKRSEERRNEAAPTCTHFVMDPRLSPREDNA